MPVVPVNFRGGADFQPLDNVKDITKFDSTVAAAVTNRIQDGTWVVHGPNGVVRNGVFPGTHLGIKAAFCSFSDHDPNDVIGHPDSGRLGQVTLLVGQYRGRTRYHLSPEATGSIVTAAAPGGENATAIGPGSLLGVVGVDAASIARITGAAPLGNGDATSCIAGDGVLFTATGLAQAEAVAVALTAQSATDGTIEYMML
jgi:hypothetical protein